MKTGIFPPTARELSLSEPCISRVERGDIDPGLVLIHGPFMESTAIHPVCVQ